MYRILPLLCDIGLGIFAALTVSWMLTLEPSWFLIGIGVVWALILDVDVLFDKDFWYNGFVSTYKESPGDHRDLIHKPVLWLILMLACAYLVPREIVLVAGLAIFLHFVHDSMGTGFGIMWLWPLSTRSFKLFAAKDDPLTFRSLGTSWSREELHAVIARHGMKDWIPHFYLRITWVSVIEYGVFFVALGWLFLSQGILLP